jgi:hypothetical protein
MSSPDTRLTNLRSTPSQVPICRVTGNVGNGTHLYDYGVNQDFGGSNPHQWGLQFFSLRHSLILYNSVARILRLCQQTWAIESWGGVMACLLCASGNQAEFPAEMIIHFSGLKNLDKPGVWAFPKLLACLDCGFARFTVPKSELVSLAAGTPTSEPLTGEAGDDDLLLPRGIAL